MNHDQAIQELRDFFCGYRRFKGMLRPQDSRIFEAYFHNLSPADQQLVTDLIVVGALGQEPRLVRRCGSCLGLLLALCLAGHTAHFQFARSALEQEFNNPHNIAQWLEAPDTPFVYDTVSKQKRDWHYPLILWTILYRLHSERIDTAYATLLNQSVSRDFRRALHQNKEHLDHGTGWLGPKP